MALIGFDNAIEVAVTTYITLNPIQRGGRVYSRTDVDKWLSNYHAKLDFLGAELIARGCTWQVEKNHIIWAHDHRNEQYHGGLKGTPEHNVLRIVREAAIWVFGVLFDIGNPLDLLEKAVLDRSSPPTPQRERPFDLAIDAQFGVIEIADQSYYVSEVLFAVDEAAYRELGGRQCAGADRPDKDGEE
jgi:hypothetical protein